MNITVTQEKGSRIPELLRGTPTEGLKRKIFSFPIRALTERRQFSV